MSRTDFGYVMEEADGYRILCNPEVYESGSICATSSPLYSQVQEYVQANPDKLFREWQDKKYKKQMIYKEINTWKKVLSDTDYCVIKCQELGLDIATEYPPEHEARAHARARINELQEELANLV